MSGFQRFVVGIVGCRAGWFAVVLLQGGTWRLEVFPDVESLWSSLSDAEILLIDIPIGLRDAGSTVR
jgi:predicted RNase H-like nuclease